jgi:hypothetical protein
MAEALRTLNARSEGSDLDHSSEESFSLATAGKSSSSKGSTGINRYIVVGEKGIFLSRSHPRASEVRRKLKRLSAELATLLFVDPLPVVLPVEYRKASGVIEVSEFSSLAPPGSTLEEQAEFNSRAKATTAERHRKIAESEALQRELDSKVLKPDSDFQLVVRKSKKKAKGVSPRPAPGPSKGQAPPKPVIEKTPTPKGNPWVELKKKFKGVGLFQRPRTKGEKLFKKEFERLKSRAGKGLTFPTPRQHPRDQCRRSRRRGEVRLVSRLLSRLLGGEKSPRNYFRGAILGTLNPGD